MIEALAAVCIFVAVSSITLLLLRGGSSARTAEHRIQALRLAPMQADLEARGLLTRSGSAFPFLRNLAAGDGGWWARTALDLQRAGLTLKVSEYLLIRLLVAVLVAIFVVFVSAASPIGMLIALAAGIVTFWLPSFLVKSLVSRRQNALSSQLVETLQLVSNALRSGFAFTQAIELAAKQIEPPMQDELSYFLRDSSLGAPVEDSLKAMVERSGSLDLDMMVTSILVQRTTGGNLSEILDNVSGTIRERFQLKGEMRALTASQRLTGLILSVYPILLLGLFFVIAPSTMKVLVTDEIGIVLLAIALTLQAIGAFTIRRITNLEV
jgi:tight adherence protein B